MARHRDALRPAELIGQRDDTRTGRRSAAVLRLLQHDTGNILAGNPSLAIVADRAQLAAVERERMNRDERFVALRLRLGQFAQFDRCLFVHCGDETEHQIALPC